MRILVLGPAEGWHAEQLRQASNRFGCSIEFASYETLNAAPRTGQSHAASCEAGNISQFDAVLSRTMPRGTLEQITFRLSILHALVRSGVKVINAPSAMELAIDKYATTSVVAQLGYDVPSTAVSQTRADAMESFTELGGDVVVKPLFGGEGRGVMRVQSHELAWTTFTTLQQLGAVIYLQEFVGPGGRDLRLFVVGENVWAIERSNQDDWRTNVSQGGQVRSVAITAEQREIALQICRSMGLAIAGVDLIFDPAGKAYVLEVNAVPGWKGTQSVVAENLAEQMIEHIARL